MSQAGRGPVFEFQVIRRNPAKVADAMHFLLLPFARTSHEAEKNSRVAESK
jgi:hypothetical protein